MSFEVNRVRRPDWIAGGGAVALFIFMFFKWFGVSYSSPSLPGIPSGSISVGGSLDGWHSLTTIRWLLIITMIAALAAVALAAAGRELESPVKVGVILAALGSLSAIFVLYRLASHPHFGVPISVSSISYPAKAGAYLSLLAALAITYGGYLKMRAEGVTIHPASATGESAQAPGATGPPEPPTYDAWGSGPGEEPPVYAPV